MQFDQVFSTKFKHEGLRNSQTFKIHEAKYESHDTVEYPKDVFVKRDQIENEYVS